MTKKRRRHSAQVKFQVALEATKETKTVFQCELIGLNRSTFYYQPVTESPLNRQLMRLMGLQAIYPKPRTTVAPKEHEVYPYLLRGLEISRSNQVWCADVTYLPMQQSQISSIPIKVPNSPPGPSSVAWKRQACV